MSFDDYFFTRPSFVGGVARVIDISGVLSSEAVLIVPTPADADRRGIASDFRVVGNDLKAAFESVAPKAATK